MDGNTTPKYGQYTGLKSPLYSTPAKACTAGWYQLKNEAYRGMISSASARYSDGVCEITSDNSVVAVLTIGNTLSKRKDVGSNVPIHTVRRPKGNVYSFRYINGQWQVLHPAAVSLEETLTGWRFADRDGSIETYDADGKLLTIRTPTAQTTSINYDTNGRLISVMGPYGDTLTYSYDEEQRISSIMTPEGNIQYEYDATNRLISVSYPDNSSRQYHYEDSAFPNHLTGITNENGHRFATWTYNSEGRVIISEHDGGAERVEFSYNPDGTTTVTDALGASRTYSFDVVQGELKVISITGDQCRSCPLGQMKERSYDVNGNLAKYIDWNGNITTFTRDNKGQQLSRTEAVGTSEARTITTEWHKDFPRPIRITEADRITEFTYDNEGRLLTKQVRPLK
jgi:YD repeat-containing protein